MILLGVKHASVETGSLTLLAYPKKWRIMGKALDPEIEGFSRLKKSDLREHQL